MNLPRWFTWIGFATLVSVWVEIDSNFVPTSDDVYCFSFDKTCSTCIQEPKCKWCSKSNKNTGAEQQRHCFSSKSNLKSICDTEENPQNSILVKRNLELTLPGTKKQKLDYENIIQLKPQNISVKLRRGVTVSFDVSYRQVKDYPLDLYYLLDLSKSMLKDKNTLAKLGENLANTMRNLTSQFKIGFGSFVDKVMLPFVNTHKNALKSPCDNCATPFSFKNNLQLTIRDTEFVRQVKAAQISGNLDSPEGGFDALMQAMVCEKEIGWRKNVRKIIVFSTDAKFHSAGDGKLAGILQPNDGRCHLNEEGFYDKYHEYDYPSVGQIDAVAQEKGINIIFAVKQKTYPLYKTLSEYIKDSSHGQLIGDSSNVIDLVASVYNSITGKVEMNIKKNERADGVSVRFFTNCGNSGQTLKETNVCTNVKEGSMLDFKVELTVNECPESRKRKKKSQIEIGTLQDSTFIDIEFICDCDCENEADKGYQINSPFCNNNGTKQCEVCVCNEGFNGEYCQCNREKISIEDNAKQSKCRSEGSNSTDSPCSGRGRCECESCRCWKERHYGKYCQCDKEMCRQHINSNLECSGNGRCNCNGCQCNPGFEGQFCQCPSKKSCIPPDGGDFCSGKGECICGKCECNVTYTGKYCEECASCGKGKCLEFRPCVQCLTWESGPLKGDACKNCTKGNIQTLPSLESFLEQHALLCTFEDELSGCEFNFTYQYAEDGYTIYAQSNRHCPPPPQILEATFGVIAGIVLIGVLTLIIWKIITTIHDRREYANFLNETQKAKWNTENNPLYKGTTTNFENPKFNQET